MKSNRYEERACEICGRMYKPSRKDQRTCASVECVRERKRLYASKKKLDGAYVARKREYDRQRRNPQPRVPKKDTIIAIGYADRQMQNTLNLVGKVNTEL